MILLKMLLDLFTVKDGAIDPASLGAKKWIWRGSNGEIKISARLFARFGPPIGFGLFLSFAGAIAFFTGSRNFLVYMGIAYASIFVFGIVLLVLFNRTARFVNTKKAVSEEDATETGPEENDE